MPSTTFSGVLVTNFQHCRKFSLRKCGKSEYVYAWENAKRAEDRHFLRYRECTPRERVSGRRAREFRLHISLAFANHGVLPLSKQRARARISLPPSCHLFSLPPNVRRKLLEDGRSRGSLTPGEILSFSICQNANRPIAHL